MNNLLSLHTKEKSQKGIFMGYVYAILNYLRTEKARHDVFDYLRAAIIMAAAMAVIRIGLGIIR